METICNKRTADSENYKNLEFGYYLNSAILKREKPKALFKTPDEAAYDWAKKHNDDSKRLNKELATYIYETDDGMFHVAPHHLIAQKDGFLLSDMAQIVKRDGCANEKIVGIAHTHGADITGYDNEDFSEDEDGKTGDTLLSQFF